MAEKKKRPKIGLFQRLLLYAIGLAVLAVAGSAVVAKLTGNPGC